MDYYLKNKIFFKEAYNVQSVTGVTQTGEKFEG